MARYLTIILAVTYLAAGTFLRTAVAIPIASDNTSDAVYTDGWQAGDNGGTGFGPWTFSYSGNTNGLLYPPQFIDIAPPLPGNSLGAPAFALTTGDQPNAFETSEVKRDFITPVAVGQTLSADINGSALSNAPAFTIGNTFDLLGTNGGERFSLFTNNGYHNDRWTATGDADTGIPAANAFHIEFKLVTPNSYDLTLSPIGGGAPYFAQIGAPLSGAAGIAISRLRISAYGTGSSTNGSKELFFDNLVLSGPAPGDFNNDNHVDAADYVVWRKTGINGQQGYEDWRTHFGQTAGSGAGASANAAVPEPATPMLLFLATAGWFFRRRSVWQMPRTR